MDAPAAIPTAQLLDVSPLTEVLASSSSSSKQPLEALSKPASKPYLSHLTALPLSELLSEPSTLQTQSHHLTSSLTSLTHTSYPTFLSLHKTTTSLTDSLTSLSTSLDALLETSLPALEDAASQWKDRTDPVLRERGKARVVLEQHEKIRDLLDIPLLIDTCVRNGYFAEALSLASHAAALASHATADKSSPSLILSSVLAEVHISITQMLSTLLSTLYEPNRKLPALWKAVNFLRKMDAFGPSAPFATLSQPSSLEPSSSDSVSSEEQLALTFLVGRESCLRSALEPCARDVSRLTADDEELDDREKEDLARYLKKYVDVWREGVYDIMTQYTTIFLERSSSSSSATVTSPHAPAHSPIKLNGNHSATSIPHQDSTITAHLHTLITTYSSRALTAHLLPILSSALPLLSLSLLPSLLTQLTYCTTAFARVGLDFRGTLGTLFAHAIAEAVTREFEHAREKWTIRLQKATSGSSSAAHLNGGSSAWEKRDRPAPEPPSKWLITPASLSSPPSPPSPKTAPTSPPHIPPQILASYPPLAEHTNALLSVLNSLRLLAPPSILPELLHILEEEILAPGGDALLGYVKAVHAYRRDDESEERERERHASRTAGEVYVGIFVPFIRRALVEGVFGVKVGEEDEDGELERVMREWEEWIGKVKGRQA